MSNTYSNSNNKDFTANQSRLIEQNLIISHGVNMNNKCCDHTHEHQCCEHLDSNESSEDKHNHLCCAQCGKLHSKYFIENHYCVCRTLFNLPSKDFEEYIVSNFHNRAPPSSNLI